MKPKKRLIWDADAQHRLVALAVKRGDDAIPMDMITYILFNESPTVDAVEVVRCKNCKFGEMCSIREAMACTDENGFCWRGERRT